MWKDGKIHCKLANAHERAIYSISWHGDYIATAGADNQMKLHRVDLEAKMIETIASIEAHPCDVNCVKFSPDGKLIATCSDDSTVKLWRITI